MEKILEVLRSLDPQDDNHWTDEGMPKLEVVQNLAGDEEITREMITEAAPLFSRVNPLETPDNVSTDAPEEPDPAETETKIEIATKEATDADKEVQAAMDKRSAAEKKRDHLLTEREKSSEPLHVQNQKEIQRFIKSQNQQRVDRAERRRQFLKGMSPQDLQDLAGKAPIDIAMQRNKARGMRRPQRAPIVDG